MFFFFLCHLTSLSTTSLSTTSLSTNSVTCGHNYGMDSALGVCCVVPHECYTQKYPCPTDSVEILRFSFDRSGGCRRRVSAFHYLFSERCARGSRGATESHRGCEGLKGRRALFAERFLFFFKLQDVPKHVGSPERNDRALGNPPRYFNGNRVHALASSRSRFTIDPAADIVHPFSMIWEGTPLYMSN